MEKLHNHISMVMRNMHGNLTGGILLENFQDNINLITPSMYALYILSSAVHQMKHVCEPAANASHCLIIQLEAAHLLRFEVIQTCHSDIHVHTYTNYSLNIKHALHVTKDTYPKDKIKDTPIKWSVQIKWNRLNKKIPKLWNQSHAHVCTHRHTPNPYFW